MYKKFDLDVNLFIDYLLSGKGLFSQRKLMFSLVIMASLLGPTPTQRMGSPSIASTMST